MLGFLISQKKFNFRNDPFWSFGLPPKNSIMELTSFGVDLSHQF